MIDEHAPPGSVTVAAFCAGARYGLATVRQLRQRGRAVEQIALIEATGPTTAAPLRGLDRWRAHARSLRQVGPRYLWWTAANPVRDHLFAARTAVLGWLRRPQPPGLVQHNFDLTSALIAQRHQPTPVDVPTLVFHGTHQPLDEAEAARSGLGWRDATIAELRTVGVPGGHLTVLAEPNVARIADELAG